MQQKLSWKRMQHVHTQTGPLGGSFELFILTVCSHIFRERKKQKTQKDKNRLVLTLVSHCFPALFALLQTHTHTQKLLGKKGHKILTSTH